MRACIIGRGMWYWRGYVALLEVGIYYVIKTWLVEVVVWGHVAYWSEVKEKYNEKNKKT